MPKEGVGEDADNEMHPPVVAELTTEEAPNKPGSSLVIISVGEKR